MSALRFSAIIILVLISINYIDGKPGNLQKSDVTDIPDIINDLPQSEIVNFLRYHLNYGYLVKVHDQMVKNLSKILSPEESVKLFNYYSENYEVKDVDKNPVLKKTVCFPTGCVDIDDSGNHP